MIDDTQKRLLKEIADLDSLPVGAYGVTYALNHGSLPSHQIVVTAAHTVEAPLALFASMDEPAIPLTPGISMSDAEILAALEGA